MLRDNILSYSRVFTQLCPDYDMWWARILYMFSGPRNTTGLSEYFMNCPVVFQGRITTRQWPNYSGLLGCFPGFSGVGFCRITNRLCRGEAVSPTYWRAQIVFIVATLQLTEGHRLHHPPLPSIFYSRSVFPFTHASRVPMNIVFIVKYSYY